jgi:2-polyprenyl-3-methyl-5-hydroxy-6-metoxy-1,4-benzoquinol methylase
MNVICCRACQSNRVEPVFDLGSTPLANRLLQENELAQSEPRYPLKLAFCPDCTLVQITETVPPEILFRDYVYFSSFSDTMLAHARALAQVTIRQRGLTGESLVVEAASNDGYLLKHYAAAGVSVLGIEPARNIAAAATANGIRTECEFFGRESATRLRQSGIQADVFHANNVLAHVADLRGFVTGMATVLKPMGVAIIETPYVKDMLDNLEFDTVYHEHLCYYSLTALDRLFTSHGLTIIDVERLAIHGGSLRITAQLTATGNSLPSPRVAQLLADERRWALQTLAPYRQFASQVQTLKRDLRTLLDRLKSEGQRIALYGASAKGATLLNYFGLRRETFDFLVDRSTVKQGRFTPGTHFRIDPPERLVDDMPHYCLLLTWNFADEILAQQQEYIRRGGRFILPLPVPRIVDGCDLHRATPARRLSA